jgi:ribonuclease Z
LAPICNLQVTDTVSTPEIAFTGDTTSDFILDPNNSDVLAAKILVLEVFCYHLLLCS